MIGPANLPALIASRYRPIRLIAAGGMGAVYEVEHTLTGERLALKVLSWSANASPEALARFKREVRASAIIKSDNVVRVTDADVAPELGGAPFLVMELLEGTDLEQAAATAPPTPATVVEWLRQVARAIDKAHQLGIVHRDLKPENLFLATKSDATPLVKILDFGIVKLMEEGTGATGSGQILGTPKYMAFEQASANAQITPATDRCALGLIAYRLLMGESYYQGGVMSILGQLLHGQLQPPSERGSRFPRAFDAWFLKACHRDPEERFASASERSSQPGTRRPGDLMRRWSAACRRRERPPPAGPASRRRVAGKRKRAASRQVARRSRGACTLVLPGTRPAGRGVTRARVPSPICSWPSRPAARRPAPPSVCPRHGRASVT
jgi:serine/threonine protein kinase